MASTRRQAARFRSNPSLSTTLSEPGIGKTNLLRQKRGNGDFVCRIEKHRRCRLTLLKRTPSPASGADNADDDGALNVSALSFKIRRLARRT